MNRFGSLIRRTASQISSNQFLRCSRSFSYVTDGESAVYHHARLFRKPLSTKFNFNLSNSVSLMGFVDRPIRVINTEFDNFGVFTLLRVKNPRDPNRSFRILLCMWDVMARKCIVHLKPNDFIFVSGRLVSYNKSPCKENSGLDLESLNYQVNVKEVNYVLAPPSLILDSQISETPKPETGMSREDDLEEWKDDKIYLWQVFFANPYEWWDNRKNKMNPNQPDFKHKDTGESLWLDSDKPVWVTKQLELLDMKQENKSCYYREGRRSGRFSDWI